MPGRRITASRRINQHHGRYSSTLESMMREVRHTLGNIDFQREAELEKLKASSADLRVEEHIEKRLLARYQEKREPYMQVLAGLRRRQQRQALAA